MADPVWPVHIGQHPYRDSLAYAPLSDDESFAVEDGGGFDITGRKAGATLIEMSATWPVERGHYPAWSAWWEGETDKGRIPFVLRDPLTGLARRWVRVPESRVEIALPYPRHVWVTLKLRSVPYA
jgi:hypothetical protein